MADLGERAAKLHWHDGLSWNEVAAALGEKRERARSRARTYKKNHPEEFGDEPYKSEQQKDFEGDRIPDDEEGVRVEEGANEMLIVTNGPIVKTLDDLLEHCKPDLETWYVHDHQVRTWQTPMKREIKSLRYEGGRIVDGFIDKRGAYHVQNYHIKAWFKRRKPEAVHPVLRPIELSRFAFERPPERKTGTIRSLVFADTQIGFRRDMKTGQLDPFHDRGVLDMIVQLACAAEVDRIDVVGDYLDLSEFTDKFLREPEFFVTTQASVLEGHWWLQRLRTLLPGATIYLYEGNHCVRLPNMLIKYLPGAYELSPADDLKWPALSVPRLLGLDGLGVEWIGDYPDGESWIGNKVCLRHGNTARKGSGKTAGAVINETDITLVCGHGHRSEHATRTVWVKDGYFYVTVYVVPCSCRTDGTVPGSSKDENWQKGCLLIEYDLDSDGFSFHSVPMENNRAVWNGRLFEGGNVVPQLRKDLEGWNW